MAATAQGLSGYAGTSGTEYVAESFFSWLKGELRIDHRLQELFDSKCQTRPTDAGTWKDDETSSGSVRISSLHGKNAPRESQDSDIPDRKAQPETRSHTEEEECQDAIRRKTSSSLSRKNYRSAHWHMLFTTEPREKE